MIIEIAINDISEDLYFMKINITLLYIFILFGIFSFFSNAKSDNFVEVSKCFIGGDVVPNIDVNHWRRQDCEIEVGSERGKYQIKFYFDSMRHIKIIIGLDTKFNKLAGMKTSKYRELYHTCWEASEQNSAIKVCIVDTYLKKN